MKFGRFWGAALCSTAFASHALANCEVDVSDYVGWQVIYAGTVTGYYDEYGNEQSDFEGCDFDRTLIIDYGSVITCDEYSYAYAYMPDIVILGNGSRMEACIDDEMYRVRNGS